ncbi:MAG: hypothetical protein IJ343_13805 [Clostridia bacterium]|nr:hypothetical protein [Clostridia bacterium]
MKRVLYAHDSREIQQKPKQADVPREEERCCEKEALSDEDLSRVSAAGESTVPTMNPEVLLGRHDIPNDKEKHDP